MKNLCLFWRLDLWYKEKFVSLEIVYFGRHATFTQVSLNCRLDTRVWLAQVCDSNRAWSLTNPTVQWRFTSFYSWGWVFEYAVVDRGPGCDILSTQVNWVTNPSFTIHCVILLRRSDFSLSKNWAYAVYLMLNSVECSIPLPTTAHTGGAHLWTASRWGHDTHRSPLQSCQQGRYTFTPSLSTFFSTSKRY